MSLNDKSYSLQYDRYNNNEPVFLGRLTYRGKATDQFSGDKAIENNIFTFDHMPKDDAKLREIIMNSYDKEIYFEDSQTTGGKKVTKKRKNKKNKRTRRKSNRRRR